MSDETLKIFIVDDDEAIRSSLARSLRKRDYRVEAFASAADFLAACSATTEGVLILDHGMPGMTGLELQRHLSARGFQMPVIFITGHGGVPESVQAIKGGAVDFLEKPFQQNVLLERIQTAMAMALAARSDAHSRSEAKARFERLTTREMEIVTHMVAHPSETSSKEVGARLGISPRTVDHHRARILEKLQIRSVPELIALAGRRGAEAPGA